jgi:hypothetical protein
VGSFVGQVTGGGNNFYNLFTTSSVTVEPADGANRNSIGGLIGDVASGASFNLDYVSNAANINAPAGSSITLTKVGGIIGSISGGTWNTFNHFSNSGTIIAGSEANKLTSTLGTKVGGIVGDINSTTPGISVSTKSGSNTGDIYGQGSVGGVLGTFQYTGSGYPSLAYLENSGSIHATDGYAGGIASEFLAGNNAPTAYLDYLANKGAVTVHYSGNWYYTAGGLVGTYNSNSLSDGVMYTRYSFNTGNITVNSTGVQTTNNKVGGLIGSLYHTGGNALYQYNYNTGDITANGGNIGGIVGSHYTAKDATFRENYSTGARNGTAPGAGIVGRLETNNRTLYAQANYSTLASATFFSTAVNVTSDGGNVNNAQKTEADLKSVSGLSFTAGTWSQSDAINNGLVYLSSNVPTTAITINVNALSKTYGAANPSITGQYSLTGCTGCITLDWGSFLTGTTNAGTYAYNTANLLSLTYVSGSASSYSLTWGSNSFTVNQKAVTLTGSKTYDGNATASGATLSVSNTVNGDTVTVTNGGTAAIASRNVGNRALSNFTGLSLSNSNYTLTGASGAIDVNARAITLSTSNVTKTYDGTTSASGSATVSVGSLGTGDSISGGTFAFTTKDYGAGNKTVTVSGVTVSDGNSGNNYTVSYASNTTSTINKKALTISGLSSANKTYDATTTATVSGSAALQSFESTGSGTTSDGKAYTGDDVSLTGTAVGTFNFKDVATATTVSFSGLSLTGAQAANYSLTAHTSASHSITAKALTISGLSSANKTYNGNTTATVSGTAALQSFEAAGSGTTSDGKAYTGDTVSLTGTATGTFNFKDVATATTVSFSGLSLTGAQAGNYSLTPHASASHSITARTVSLSASKTYDGNVNLGTVTVATGVGSETLNYSGATAASKNVGAGNYLDAITLSDGSNGGVTGNYTLPSLTAASGNNAVTINAKSLTLTASKTYDGTTGLTGYVTLGGLIGTETLNVSSATASNSHVATANKYVSAITLANGTNGGITTNYSVPAYSYSAGVNSLTISAATLTPTITNTGVTKVYDGALTSSFTPTYSFTGLVSGDTGATLTSTGKNYNSKDVASANQITVSGLAISGITGSNSSASTDYVLDATSKTVAATITAKPLTVSGLTASNKTYNALTDVTITNWGSVTTGVGSETLVLNHGTASFADKTKATGKTVTATGYSLADGTNGGVAGNYSLTSTSSTTTADITAKTITLAGSTGVTKTYDGRTSMPVGTNGYGSLVGVESGDTVTISGAPVYSSANQGARTITQNTVAIAGTDAGNYTLSWSNGSGTINPASLTITANADAKFVTQADVATYNGVSYSGFVNGETTAVLNLAGLAYTRTNAGVNSAGTYTGVIQPSGVTANNGNYTITYANGNYTIIPANQLLVTVNNAAFTYGTVPSYTIASAKYLSCTRSDCDAGLGSVNTITTLAAPSASGNTYTYSDGAGGSAVFTLGPASAQTGTNGALKAGNYTVAATNITETSANFSNSLVVVGALAVNQKGLTAAATGVTKTYDATTAMTNVSLSLTGLQTNDVVSVAGNGNFGDKNAGTNKTYTISSLTLSGTDAANYYLSGGDSFSGNDGAIAKKTVSLSATKTYDGSTTLGSSALTISGMIGSETLGFTGATANSKDVSTASHVSAITLQDGTNGGLAANYQAPSLTAAGAGNAVTINRNALTMTGQTAADKTFDGLSAAVTMLGTVSGLVGTETLAVSGTGTFADPNVGIGKTVTIALTLANGTNGGLASNYSIADATTTATINPVPTTVPPPPPSVPTSPPPPSEVPTPAPAPEPPAEGGGSGSGGGTTSGDGGGSGSGGGTTSGDGSGSGSGGGTTSGDGGGSGSGGGTTSGDGGGSGSGGGTTSGDSGGSGSGGGTTSGDGSGSGSGGGTTSGDGGDSGSGGGTTSGDGGGSGSGGGTTSGDGSGSGSGGGTTSGDGGGSGSGGGTTSGDGGGSGSGGGTTSGDGSGSGSGGGTTSGDGGGSGSGGGTSSGDGGGSGSGGSTTSGDGSGSGSGGGTTSGDGSGSGSGPVTVTLSAGPDVSLAAGSGQGAAESAGGSSQSGSGGGESSGFISVRSFGTTSIPADSVFSFTLPKDTFKHADPKTTVVLEARMGDGKPLPDWLSFDPGTGRFTGRAPQGVQEIEIRVVARDTSGAEAATIVVLRFNAASEVK